jgi:hypothetical protein
MIRSVAVILLAAFLFSATSPPASASVRKEGTVLQPFSLTDAGGLLVTTDSNGDPSLTVPYEAATAFDGKAIEFEPRSIRVAADGSYLVACGKHGYVLRINPSNGSTRMYSAADIPGLERPFDAFPLPDGGMLITDRGANAGEGRVVQVDASNRVVWQYGGISGLGAGQIWDPFTAERLVNGNTLISDSLGFRIIEVNTAGTILWSYGTFMEPGSGLGFLNRPHSAQRLSNGNTLICNAEGNKIIEVTAAGQIVWSYGTGTAGTGTGEVKNPNSALRVANGDTIISDSDNNRVIAVDQAGRIVQEYGVVGRIPSGGAISNPRAVARLANGTTLIADLGNMRLGRYGYALAREYVATSGAIDPSVGAFKAFTSIIFTGTSPTGTSIGADYSTDGTTWNAVPAGGMLPSGVTGTAIRYRLRLKTGDASVAPSVSDVAITWNVTTPSSATTKTATTSAKTTVTATSQTGNPGTSSTGSGSGGSAGSVSPGGTTEIPSGTSGSAGGSGYGAVGASTMSGWVMKESKDDVSWAGVAASGSGPATVGGLHRSVLPSAALLLMIYALGLAWSPGASAVARLAATALPH